MLLEKRIIAFAKLGAILRTVSKEFTDRSSKLIHISGLESSIEQAHRHNGWFTEENILLAIGSLGEMLREDKLTTWLKKYPIKGSPKLKIQKVGVIMAGNIPLVGFHDFLCVLISGNTFVGKLASDDSFLLPAVAEILITIEPGFKDKIHFTPSFIKAKRVSKPNASPERAGKRGAAAVDCFIATGSNNSARYFEYYFKEHPHIIRKNRNAIAILNGKETEADLANLGKDIFQYFGMGCRNVSKMYIPEDFNLDKLFTAIVDFGDVINHNKYYNNHQYYRTIYLLNSEKFLDNNFLMLKESEQIASPVATLYYERYKNQKELTAKLVALKDQVQCVVTSSPALLPKEKGVAYVTFGQAQSPELWDYADGVDTIEFLLALK
jgi:hypothetical protein